MIRYNEGNFHLQMNVIHPYNRRAVDKIGHRAGQSRIDNLGNGRTAQNGPSLVVVSPLPTQEDSLLCLCWKNGRARAGKRVYSMGMGVNKRARVLGCNYMHYILENLSVAAQMGGNYSMTSRGPCYARAQQARRAH